MKQLILESNLGHFVGKECIGVIIEANLNTSDEVSFKVVGILDNQWLVVEDKVGDHHTVHLDDIIKVYGKPDPITGELAGL